MEFRRVLALRGPNIWARFPVLEVLLDLGRWDNASAFAPFQRRLADALAVVLFRTDADSRDRLLASVPTSAELPRALAELTVGLQTFAGTEVRFSCVEPVPREGAHRVMVEFENERLVRECLNTAREICLAALADAPYDTQKEATRLREFADNVCLGPSTRSIVRAAIARGIPVRRLNDESLVQLGHGVHQHRIRAAETDHTNAIAEGIAQDKELTKNLLRAVGVPVPEGRPATSEADAWQAACEIGLPVVVKPRDANHGRGVAINLTRREQIEAAYTYALKEGSGVLVERFALGAEHRLLVVGDRMVAASRGEPEEVVGDGAQSVKQLVDVLNQDPRRGLDYSFPLGIVELDPIGLLMLEQQGYQPDSVPSAGAKVVIHRNGDYTIDETDEVHPDVAEAAVRAAQIVGLDVAGIDMIVEDIGRPIGKQGSAVVVEVNAGPSLQMHLEPQHGTPRPVGEAIVATLFPDNHDGRVPIVALAETPANSCAARLLAHLLSPTGQEIGLCSAQGMFVGPRRIQSGDCREAGCARALLINPLVETAVFEVARSSVLAEGLGFDACDTVVILADRAPDDDLALAAFLHAILPGGCLVFEADDTAAQQWLEQFPGRVIVSSAAARSAMVNQVREHGAGAVFVREEQIVLADGNQESPLLALESLSLPKPSKTSSADPIRDLLAAIAAAWSVGVLPEQIRERAGTFRWEA